MSPSPLEHVLAKPAEELALLSPMDNAPVGAGTPRRSALGPQVVEADGDQLPDHGRAAGFVEAGVTGGIDFFDHRQREPGLDQLQTLVCRFRWPAAPAHGRRLWVFGITQLYR